jgi:hypothetical protein
MSDLLGAFPVDGAVTYLTDNPRECRRLMRGPKAPVRTWFHGTTERVARLACVQGLVPGCWLREGGECCVHGYYSLDAFLERRKHLWIVEVRGPVLAGDLKAWWVPPSYVRGIWRFDSFISREEVAAMHVDALVEPRTGCGCGLSSECAEQQSTWRSTWPASSSA